MYNHLFYRRVYQLENNTGAKYKTLLQCWSWTRGKLDENNMSTFALCSRSRNPSITPLSLGMLTKTSIWVWMYLRKGGQSLYSCWNTSQSFYWSEQSTENTNDFLGGSSSFNFGCCVVGLRGPWRGSRRRRNSSTGSTAPTWYATAAESTQSTL